MRKFLLLVLTGLFCSASFGQQNYWSSRISSNGITTDKAVNRLSYPKAFKLFDLNIEPLRQNLFTITDKAGHSTVISLPNADGNLEQFEVFEASNFDPALQAKYPDIRAFSGRGITDRYATLKLSISPQGIQTMVFRADKENEFMEPYSQDHTVYSVFKSHRAKGQLPWVCSTLDEELATNLNAQVYKLNSPQSNTGELRTIRLAQSCNGEYSNWFGAFAVGQYSIVLAAFNATLTRCNGTYEKDLALHTNLIPNDSLVVFYDPLTDPYTTMGQWNNQLQATLTAIIGEANYDLGHMFGQSGGGGNAGCIGCVCVDNQKGRGITSPADGIPMGDNFDIDYVAHEVGHQLGGNHSFTFSNEGTQAQKEVGAGITIMGYAGITSYDPAPHSIDIFHEANITQIQANLATKTCPTLLVMTVNHPPVVAPVSNYTIPISTPFALTGSATDPENDPITYCWEQNDVHGGQTAANSVAYATKPVGPNWLSFPATVSGTRLCPRLSTILAGLLITPPFPGGDAICNIEALSSVSRSLNFRLTVKDNRPYVPGSTIGQTQFTDMVVTVTNTSGPFQVTSPNTNVSWLGGLSQVITWDVNGTTNPPVSCANVMISLSTDGGLTFPTVLAANTPNDGSESVTLPCVTTANGRIKVEAVGNIFFDISNSNFSIQQGFQFASPAPVNSGCPVPSSMSIILGNNTGCGFTNPITLTASGNPVGTTVSFSPNPVTPGSNTNVTLNGTNTLPPGNYVITVTGTATGAPVQTRDITYIIAPGATPTITIQPLNQIACVGSNVTFTVAATNGSTYQWQVSTAAVPTFTDIPGATSVSYTATGVTVGMNGNQYRVVVFSSCASSVISNPASLTVIAPVSITAQPAASIICSGSNTSFSVTGTSTQTIVYQWQDSTSAHTWANIPGATTATLNLSAVTASMNGNKYRVLLSNATCSVPTISAVALLTVRQLPTVTLSASLTALLPGQSSTLTAVPSASAGGVLTTTWLYNGVAPVPPITGNTYIANVEHVGTYQVLIQETFSGPTLVCSNQSAIVTITATPSDNLFIFPSPNDGSFKVAYYNNGGASTKRTIVIFDSKGSQVYNRQFNIIGAYTLIPIDLQRENTGIYYVVVGDTNGKKLATGKVHVR